MSTSRWDEVTILRKRGVPAPQNDQAGVGGANASKAPGSTQKKTVPPNKNKPNMDPRQAAKIENESETFNLKTIGVNTGKAIQKARAAKGISQKELATKINEKVSIVVECESGKLVNVSQQILIKLERALDVQLRGRNIGEPLVKKTAASSGKSTEKK